jgi:hypothetical protein
MAVAEFVVETEGATAVPVALIEKLSIPTALSVPVELVVVQLNPKEAPDAIDKPVRL